jgi:Na+/H+ antiporter NhaD/arsenite permease-like protein
MDLGVASLVALAAAVAAGSFLPVNVGLVALALAFLVGSLAGALPVREVAGGFPVSLFLTLVGVTLLFSQARANGTLDRVADLALRLARGRAGLVPLIFFALALVFSAIGPGNIAAVALLAPVAMATAGRAGVPAFLMAIMVCTGANAGAFSPFAPTGIIANELMAGIGLEGLQWRNFFNALVAQSFVGLAGYLLFGGAALMRAGNSVSAVTAADAVEPFGGAQWLTIAVVSALILAVVLLDVDVMAGAFVGVVLLSLMRAADEKAALAGMPWSTVLMVCGVTVLIGVVDRLGGMDLLTTMISGLSNQQSITGVMAMLTGVISVYSSSSAVVLPAFLPTIPGLIEKLGGGDALAIASSINVGAHLVDVSPLSTLGALCIANAAAGVDRKRLFNQMLVWGLSMCLVGALVCWVFFGLL